MAPTLYVTLASPPCNAVRLVAKSINLDLNLQLVDLIKGETKLPDFLKMNPQHTVPTLVDGDFVLWDSHAIMIYLLQKYGKSDVLYPNDIAKQAVVTQRLHFDSGVAWSKALTVIRALVYDGIKTVAPKDRDGVIESYGFLESFLEGKQWIAGDFVSIADFSLVTTVLAINLLVKIDSAKFPRVTKWIKQAESWEHFNIISEGQEILNDIFQTILA